MNGRHAHLLKFWISFATFSLLLTATACKFSTPASKAKQESSSAAPAKSDPDPGIDGNCLGDRFQDPPEAFHYSYNRSDSAGILSLGVEADLTPQTIDATVKGSSSSTDFHAKRSDPQAWKNAWPSLPVDMGTIGVDGTSAMVREGTDQVNGYDTIRYSIDTARDTPAESALHRATFGAGGWQKGAAWVTAKGCPVKLALNTEYHRNDGNVEKIHVEEAMVKK
jgi:hypothetical protein